MLKWLLSLALLTTAFLFLQEVHSCNEAVCGSVVSKCLLTQSCKCDLKNCTCCKDCYNCLSYLYTDCCSCVDMCPKPNETDNVLSKKSHVEDLPDGGIPNLFNVLTDSPDNRNRWDAITFPIDLDTSLYGAKKEIKIQMQSAEQEVVPLKPSNIFTVNCTVAFWSQCMNWTKCKTSCVTMGASSYRWFHDGCCECVGRHCINYGINESKCKGCAMSETPEEEFIDDDELVFGEDIDE